MLSDIELTTIDGRIAADTLFRHSKENANVPSNPEAVNLSIAEHVVKEFMLGSVMEPHVANAHRSGDIHIHDLGLGIRPYCCGQNPEYIKKFGLQIPNSPVTAKPAKRPEVFIAHLIKFSAALQCHFSGAIGWDALNLFMAPFLRGLDQREIHQLAQVLVYEFSQQSVARGGQSIFSDINLYWEVPKHFRETPVLGPGGVATGEVYADYQAESQAFLMALLDVYDEGDAMGRPFFFPKPDIHITDEMYNTDGHEEFLLRASEVASKWGNPYFIFDRGDDVKISECCRLQFELGACDLAETGTPWKMRSAALQNVTVNLPAVAYRNQLYGIPVDEGIYDMVRMAAEAHRSKLAFIDGMIERTPETLALLTMNLDGDTYMRRSELNYLVGILGLDEAVQCLTGQRMHESRDAYKEGMRIVAMMRDATTKLGEEFGMKMVLEQTPAESTAYRMAQLDKKRFPPRVARFKGNGGKEYYTNSTHLDQHGDISAVERVKKEGAMHPLINAGAITHIWLGETAPDPASIAAFVTKTHSATKNTQITFSPEFSTCRECERTHRGLLDDCPDCGCDELEHITRVTGYFSKVGNWNDGKRAELGHRVRGNI